MGQKMQICVTISLCMHVFSCPNSVHRYYIVQYNIADVVRHRNIDSYTVILQIRGCQIRQVFKNGEFTIRSIQKWRIYNASRRYPPERHDDRDLYRLPTRVANSIEPANMYVFDLPEKMPLFYWRTVLSPSHHFSQCHLSLLDSGFASMARQFTGLMEEHPRHGA